MNFSIFETISLLVVMSALFAFINHKFLKLPESIGLMLIALILSLSILGLDQIRPGIFARACEVVEQVNFSSVLMNGMLSFLLFAEALHIKSTDLSKEKWAVLLFATAGVLISTLIVGGLFYLFLGVLGFEVRLVYCLLFGALISPTDPIAVLSILKEAHVPRSLETRIAGESLFNDGIGVVVYLSLLLAVNDGLGGLSFGEVALLFAEEAIGGLLFGAALGIVAVRLLKLNDDPKIEVMLTMAVAMGGYGLAMFVHVSGPIAMVIAGLFVGNNLNQTSSKEEQQYLDIFWEMVDELLNALLFVLIGLEILTLNFQGNFIMIGIGSFFIVLFARICSIGLSLFFVKGMEISYSKSLAIMTWGGLRGGISIALALSLPNFAEKELIVIATYLVVILSILIQGLTIKRAVRRLELSVT